MKLNCNLILVVLFVTTIFGCKENDLSSKKTSHPYENHLIPFIQVESEPRFYTIKERMKYYNIPGFSIAIINNDKIEFAKGYGLGRVKDEIGVNTNSIFKAGSISKTLAALVVLKLAEKGTLSLDVDISNYLKTWILPENEFTKQEKVTLRRLLNHTAGINNFNSKGYQQGEKLPTLEDLLTGKAREDKTQIDTIPGARYNYSNLGYAIVQKVIEDVTHMRFEKLAKDLIFTPLKMTNSTFETIQPSNDVKFCYSYGKDGNPNVGYWNNVISKPTGGLFSTPTDLARLNIALLEVSKAENEFISLASFNEMMNGEQHGLGIDLVRKDASFSFSHSGRSVGYFSYMITYPQEGKGIVLMTNSDNGGDLFKEILRGFSALNAWDIIHPKKIQTIKIPQLELEKYIGTYSLELGGYTYMIRISQDGDNLKYNMVGEDTTYPLRALAPTKFIDIVEGEEFEFVDIKEKAMKIISNGEYDYIRLEY